MAETARGRFRAKPASLAATRARPFPAAALSCSTKISNRFPSPFRTRVHDLPFLPVLL